MRSLAILLKDRTIAILWSAQVLSAIGDQIYMIAVLWIGVELAGERAGLVAAGHSFASVIVGIFGGVLIDRWDRRRLMIGIDLIRAAVVAALAVTAARGQLALGHLIVAGLVLGAVGSLFRPALQAGLTTIVTRSDDLHAVTSLFDMTVRIARATGPGLSALMATVVPLHHYFTIEAASFLVSAAGLAALDPSLAWRPLHDGASSNVTFQGFLRHMRSAALAVRADSAICWALATLILLCVAWAAAFMVGVPLLAKNVLKRDVGAYSRIVASYGVGNLASNLMVGALTIRSRVRFMFLGRSLIGVGFIVVAFATKEWLALVGTALAATGGPMSDLMLTTRIQSVLPRHQLGTVFSLRFSAEGAGLALGLALAAMLFSVLSPSDGIGLCGVVMLLSGLIPLLRFATLREA